MQDDGYFDDRVASRYDESSADMFDPAVVEPAVDFLAEIAGSGRLGNRRSQEVVQYRAGAGHVPVPRWYRGLTAGLMPESLWHAFRLRYEREQRRAERSD